MKIKSEQNAINWLFGLRQTLKWWSQKRSCLDAHAPLTRSEIDANDTQTTLCLSTPIENLKVTGNQSKSS